MRETKHLNFITTNYCASLIFIVFLVAIFEITSCTKYVQGEGPRMNLDLSNVKGMKK